MINLVSRLVKSYRQEGVIKVFSFCALRKHLDKNIGIAHTNCRVSNWKEYPITKAESKKSGYLSGRLDVCFVVINGFEGLIL